MSEPVSDIVPPSPNSAWPMGVASSSSLGTPSMAPCSAVRGFARGLIEWPGPSYLDDHACDTGAGSGVVARQGSLRQRALLNQWLSISNTLMAVVLLLGYALVNRFDLLLFGLALVPLVPCVLVIGAMRLRRTRLAASLNVASGSLLGLGTVFTLHTQAITLWQTFILSSPLWGTAIASTIILMCLVFTALLGSAAVRAFMAARLCWRLPGDQVRLSNNFPS